MLLKTICAKSEGFDDCNTENVAGFLQGDYDQVNELFLSTKYYRSAHLTKRQNCERKCNATTTISFSDDPNRRLLCLCIDIFEKILQIRLEPNGHRRTHGNTAQSGQWSRSCYRIRGSKWSFHI